MSRLRSLLLLSVAAIASIASMASIATVALADTNTHDQVLADADATIKTVSKLRGLALKTKIKRGVMSKEQLEARLLTRIDEQYTKEEIAGEGLSMKRFGLLGADADYLAVVTKLLTSQIAGFYDPFAGELFLADWATVGGSSLLAHEIDHALQDQHFGLATFMTGEKSNADATAARQALVEGDGIALMMEHLLDGMGRAAPWGESGFAEKAADMTSAQADSIKDAPFAMREALIFPYADGLRFVAHFRKHHDWKRIDKIFAKPPLSTEHILHPELYESYERPIVIGWKKPAELRDYTVAYSNVVGEKGLAVMLEAHGVKAASAADAAAGWGGDAIVVFTPPGHAGKVAGTVGVLRTRWDVDNDAIEFFNAVSHALPSLAEGGQLVADGPDDAIRYRNKNGAVVSVQRVGADVVLLIGAPPAREPDLRAAALAWPAKVR